MTESLKVSNFSKAEFEAYQRMHHEKWDHNVMVPGIFKEFATEINAKIEERISDRNREIAKKMVAAGKLSDAEIADYSGLSVEDVVVLRSQMCESD